jgi:hypothetical protein
MKERFASLVLVLSVLGQAAAKPPAPRVGQIFVSGNTITKQDVILKAVNLFPGQVLNPADLRQAEKSGMTVRPIPNMVNHETNELFFDDLESGLRQGGFLTRWLDRVLPLAEARKAHESMEDRAQFGKLVLLVH